MLKQSLLRFLVARGWLNRSSNDVEAVTQAVLACLSASPARMVLLNLEDLWLERESQNLPGAGQKSANWQRKARYRMEEFFDMPQVRDLLNQVGRLRSQSRKGSARPKGSLRRSGRKK